MTKKRKRTWGEIQAIHAKGRPQQQGGVACAPMPPPAPPRPEVVRTPTPAREIATGDDARDEDIDAIRDALVLLAMNIGGGDLAIQAAARELSRRRSVPLADALEIMRAARLHMRDVGRLRKKMDLDTEHELIGETRARFALLFATAMKPENFTKGGAAAAVKAAEKLAILDGCPVDGIVQVAVRAEHEHTHRIVIDPEREKIALAILQSVRPVRVLEAEVGT